MQPAYFIPLILSSSLAWLALALPAIPLVGWDITQALTTERSLRKVLGPAIGLSLWIEAVHLFGRATGSFSRGLVMGTLSMVAIAMGWRLVRRMGPRLSTRSLGDGAGWPAVFLALAVAVPIALMAFLWSFHDEDLYVGHLSITSRILNDQYPPRHLTFPAFELRYHYGFDLLAACISAIFRVPPDIAIDWVSVCMWIYGALLLYTIGEVWLGPRRGVFTMLLTLFAGGLPFCLNGKPFEVREILGVCLVNKAASIPGIVSNFFQHPWALGLPLAFATILVATAREHQRRWIRYGVLTLLLSAISIAEVAMFLALTPAVLAAEIGHLWHDEKRNAPAFLGVVAAGVVTLGIAVVMGGFFAPNPAADRPSLFYLKWGVLDGFGPSLHWFVQSFGLVGLLGLFGIVFLPRRARMLSALLLGGSLFVISVVHHPYSGDDLTWKFGVVALVVMGLGAARTVTLIWPGKTRMHMGKRLTRMSLAGILMIVSMCGGLAYAALFSVFPGRASRLFVHSCRDMSRADFDTATFLRREMRPGELVFRREPIPAHRYAQWAGLSVPWTDWATPAFGFSPDLLHARSSLLNELPPAPEAYLAQGISWFVLDPADTKLHKHADVWIAEGKARDVTRFGQLRVVKLNSGIMGN